MAFDALGFEHPMYPKAVEPGLLKGNNGVGTPGFDFASLTELCKQCNQPDDVTGSYGVP